MRQLRTLFDVGTVGGLTDGELLDRFQTGRRDVAELAFAALVERHGPMVLRVCRRILRNDHEAQDAFQATFLVLVRKAGSIQRRAALGPWLHGVACRVAACARATLYRKRTHERRAAELARPFSYESASEDVGSALHEEIDRLQERHRLPIVLCCLEGLSREQAALRLGWRVGTVQSRLARGRQRLRERLTRRGLFLAAGTIAAILSSEADAATVAVPSGIRDATTYGALKFAADSAAAGAVPAGVAALTQGVLKTMMIQKIVAVAATSAAVALVGVGITRGQGQAPAVEKASSVQDGGATQPPDRLGALERKLDRVLEALNERSARAERAQAEEFAGQASRAREQLKQARDRVEWAERLNPLGYVSESRLRAEEASLRQAQDEVARLSERLAQSQATLQSRRVDAALPKRAESDVDRWDRIERRMDDFERRLQALERSRDLDAPRDKRDAPRELFDRKPRDEVPAAKN
jgi:RNA polymerase sigma factor (sigma-70 family)